MVQLEDQRILKYKKSCDSYYEIPTTKAQRGTSFGFGNKDIGIRDDKFVPPVATYTLDSEFNYEKRRRGISFGTGREVFI